MKLQNFAMKMYLYDGTEHIIWVMWKEQAKIKSIFINPQSRWISIKKNNDITRIGSIFAAFDDVQLTPNAKEYTNGINKCRAKKWQNECRWFNNKILEEIKQ